MTAAFEPEPFDPQLKSAIEEVFADSEIASLQSRDLTISEVVLSAYQDFADVLAHELGIRPRAVEGGTQ